LWIGGIGVASGYLHAPDLTKAKFFKNPFGEGQVYRTGDIVNRLASGDYVFVRRMDDQVIYIYI
jgi:non-ribosomal peptide synthetase component F